MVAPETLAVRSGSATWKRYEKLPLIGFSEMGDEGRALKFFWGGVLDHPA